MMPSLQVLPQSRSSALNNSTAGYGTPGLGARSSNSLSASNHKAMATCTLSLAHAEVVVSPEQPITTGEASTPLVPSSASNTTATPGITDIKTPRSRFTSTSSSYRPNEVNVIPFPTTTGITASSIISAMSASRPLPIPPKPHALLRASAVLNAAAPPLPAHMITGEEDLPRRIRVRKGSLVSSPAPALRKSPLGVGALKRGDTLIVPPQPMERRRSRDPNVADHLVVEVDDADEEVVAARMGGKVVVEDEDEVRGLVAKVEEAKGMLAMAIEKVSEVLHDVIDIPKRPSSPTPDAPVSTRSAGTTSPTPPTTPTSPESTAPPAYSSLPPPYSASDYEDVKGAEAKVDVQVPVINITPPVTEERQPAPIVVPIPSRVHKPSISSASSSSSSSAGPSGYKRTRISTSELKVLLYLYRTVVYGLEMRRRREEKEEREAKASRANSRAPSPSLREKQAISRQKKPLGPRSSPTPSLKSTLPPPESKSQLESALFSATASPPILIKGKEKAQESTRGFGAFPLVEDDEEVSAVLDEDLEEMEEDYIVPRTPAPSPSQSPRSAALPLTAVASAPTFAASSRTSTPAPGQARSGAKKEKTKAEINAELDVQDALLAIRLREFLRVQGVCESDLLVEVEDEVVEDLKPAAPTMELLQEEEEVHTEEQEEDEGNILDEYFMGIEEDEDEPVSDSETAAFKTKARGVLVEDDDATPPAKTPPPPPPPPTISTTPSSQSTPSRPRTMSPPPMSPSPRPRAVLPTSYMIALLTMRMRHPSRRPSSSSSSDKSGKGRSKVSNEVDSAHASKRRSGLRVIVEVD